MSQIKLVVVEDDPDIRSAMTELLPLSNPSIVCVRAYERAEDFLREFDRLMVDVVLMDITLPGGIDGIQAVRQAKPHRPGVQFLMCTSHNDAEHTFDSLCAGATGYILKTARPDQVAQAVEDIFAGGSPMSPEIARLVVSSFPNKNQNQSLLDLLSNREQEIVHSLAKGYSYQEIADSLFISIETVRTYLRKIYEKLHVHSKVEALNKIFPK